MTSTEWSIQEVAKAAGTTSRTLRHYDGLGLLPPTRVGGNGYRYYDQDALVRLQRILLLRDLGLGLPDIGDVLDDRTGRTEALRGHIDRLRQEGRRIERQIAAVERTLTALHDGGEIMPDTMFDGFDHAQHEDEVRERWGDAAWEDGARWWESQTPEQQRAFQREGNDLIADWRAAADAGVDPAGERGQGLARRQADWLRRTPGVPTEEAEFAERLRCLGEMYVADARFAATYGGPVKAAFVRDALMAYAGPRT